MTKNKFKKLRKEAGLTQRSCSELMKLSVRAVGHWEQGINPVPEYAVLILKERIKSSTKNSTLKKVKILAGET